MNGQYFWVKHTIKSHTYLQNGWSYERTLKKVKRNLPARQLPLLEVSRTTKQFIYHAFKPYKWKSTLKTSLFIHTHTLLQSMKLVVPQLPSLSTAVLVLSKLIIIIIISLLQLTILLDNEVQICYSYNLSTHYLFMY